MSVASSLLHQDPKKRKQRHNVVAPDSQRIEYIKHPGPDKPFKLMTGLEYMAYCDSRLGKGVMGVNK